MADITYAAIQDDHLDISNGRDMSENESSILLASQKLNGNAENSRLIQKVVIYKRRWFILCIYSLNSIITGMLPVFLSSVNNIVAEYYQTTSVAIEWLNMMFMVFYVFLGIPSSYCISRWKIRPVIIMASFLNLCCLSLHLAGYKRDRLWLVYLGNAFAAVAEPAMLQMISKISFLWFPEDERMTATSIGILMNILGLSIGFVHPTLVITGGNVMLLEKQLKMFYASQVIASALVFFITLAYQEKPPTPPVLATERRHINYIESIRELFRNNHFIILSQSYAIYTGLNFIIFGLLNPIITWKFHGKHQELIGWMGFANNISSILSIIVIGRLLDRFRHYRVAAISLNLASMVIWLCFTLVLVYTTSFKSLFILFAVFGIFFTPFFATGIEQAAEMTYPVSEEVSSAVILTFVNLYGFVLFLTLGIACQHGYTVTVMYVIAALYLCSTLLSCYAKTRLHRHLSIIGSN